MSSVKLGSNLLSQSRPEALPSTFLLAVTRFSIRIFIPMRTDDLRARAMNQKITAHRHVFRFSIVRTGGSVE